MNGSEIFHSLADKYQDSIEDTHTAEKFFMEFMELTKGAVNTDFIDGNNHDRIEKVEFDHSEGLMTIHFKLPEDDEESREMWRMAFPCDRYSMIVKLDTIRFLRSEKKGNTIGIAIRGVTDNLKKIKKSIKGTLPDKHYKEVQDEFFSTQHYKYDNRELSNIIGVDTPIVACWIIPKDYRINATDSQRTLYRYNIWLLTHRLDTTVNDLLKQWPAAGKKENRIPLLQSAGNSLRNIGETLLKLQINYHFDKIAKKSSPYHSLLWGDSFKLLNNCGIFTAEDKEDYNKFIRKVNELSHATGIPADLSDVLEASVLLRKFIFSFSDLVESIGKPNFNVQPSLPSPADYIDCNYPTWNFSDSIQETVKTTDGKCRFRIKKEDDFLDISSFTEETGVYLSKDGTFRELDPKADDCLLIYSRSELKALIDAIYEDIKAKCASQGLDSEAVWIHFNLSPQLERSGTPSHLFTLEEIRTLMKDADDSQLNQLVIDEDGYPHLNHTPGEGNLYPVSQESWHPYNYYVGADSSLSDAEPSYHLCLEGWLFYLTTGQAFYSDLYPNIPDLDAMLRQINDLTNEESVNVKS